MRKLSMYYGKYHAEDDMVTLHMMFDDELIKALKEIQIKYLPKRPVIEGDSRMYTESQYQSEKMHQAIDDAIKIILAQD